MLVGFVVKVKVDGYAGGGSGGTGGGGSHGEGERWMCERWWTTVAVILEGKSHK